MSEPLAALIDDLASEYADGLPAIVLVDDYLEREQIVTSVTAEAELHDIEVVHLATPAEAAEKLAPTDAVRAVAVLIDAGAAEKWAPWLESNREAFPRWARFFVILMTVQDVPVLAKLAPSFMSWAKAQQFRKVDLPAPIPVTDVNAEIARLTRETGMTMEAFVEAWKKGDLPDTYRSSAWLSLAWAASRKGSS